VVLVSATWALGGRGQRRLLNAPLLLLSQLVPNPLQGHFPHEEGDGKITLVPVSTEKQERHNVTQHQGWA
jgi:hypothetical protein